MKAQHALDIDWFRQRLLEMRADLEALGEDSKLSRRAVELDQTSVGRLSRVDALQGQQMALAAQRRREQHLHRITAALGRIDDGRFGECIECGEPIADKRLRFDPSISTCIRCASGSKS